QPPCSSTRTAGRRRLQPPCAAPVASWSPAVASPSKTSLPRSTRSRRPSKRRPPMPGLLRGVARTAVIAGTPTTVSNRASRRQGQRWAQQEEAQQQQAPAPVAAAPAPAAGGQSMIDQLKELGELKAQGILTEEEFAAQKAKLLNA